MSFAAEVLKDSVSPAGVRLTTLRVVLPRIVLAEFNTHRVFSRNSASSRAIPVEKRISAIRANPFVPAAFAANRKGMQAGNIFDEKANAEASHLWMESARFQCSAAERFAHLGVHKQWANRLTEFCSWHEVIVTATEWANFFHQRVHPDAQPEIQTVARLMREAMDASDPVQLAEGGWHLPYVRDEDLNEVDRRKLPHDEVSPFLIKLSVARCARVSYLTHEGKRDIAADIELFRRLMLHGHMSPYEHAARPFSASERDEVEGLQRYLNAWMNVRGAPRHETAMRLDALEFCGNLRGWVPYRKTIPHESDRLSPDVTT